MGSQSEAVKLYGFGEKCEICQKAKEKLEKYFGLEVEEHSYVYHTTFHEGWNEDGSTAVQAARALYGHDAVPLIDIGDGVVRSYPEAMSLLKKHKCCAAAS